MKTLPPFALRLLAASALVLTGCGGGSPNPPSVGQTAAAVTVLTKNDAGKTFTFDPGATFRIELASNPTTGYSWQPKPRGGSVIVMKSTYVPDGHAPGVVGSGGKEIFPCKAVKKGETTIRLTYLRPGGSGKGDQKIEFKIVVR